MALDAAEGVISDAEQYLANSLAASARFQTWVDAADATEALGSIYFTTLPSPENGNKFDSDELAALFPCALIYTDEQIQGSVMRKTGSLVYQGGGLVAFRLYEAIAADNDLTFSEMERRWKNTVGAIINDVAAVSETADCLAATEIAVTEIYRADKDEVVFLDMNTAAVLVTWGAV